LVDFSPGQTRIYKNGELKTTYTGSGLTFSSIDAVKELQFAQNSNIIIIVHESKPPLVFTLSGDGQSMAGAIFEITYAVKASSSDKELDISDYDNKPDEVYAGTGYLTADGNYPRAVTFFNGRAVFAGTVKTPQRLFFSRAGDYHDFSTKKLSVTETRGNYSVACGG
jgi:hypothetical protein